MPGRASGATVYATVRQAGNLTDDERIGGRVRVDLVAELMGARMPVGSALLPVGASGIAVSATGFAVDGWHVSARSTVGKLECDIRLAADQCCGGGGAPRVVVPQLWRPTELLEAQLPIIDADGDFPSLVEQGTGMWRVEVVDPLTTFTVPRGERVTVINARLVAGGGAGGSVTLPNRTTTSTILLDHQAWIQLLPRGAMVGPCDITCSANACAAVELVR